MRPRLVIPLLLFLVAQSASAAPARHLLARDRTEPVVAVNPTNPSTVLAVSNTNYDAPIGKTFPPGLFVSHNHGHSFRYKPAPILYPYTTGADPSVAIAGSGTMFVTYLGETPSYCSAGQSAVLLTRSYDGGHSFRTPAVVDDNSADDKPTMAVRSVPNGRAHLFFAWTRWSAHGSSIWFARSTDGGQTFSRSHVLYVTKQNAFGAVPVALPGGRVAVLWASAASVSGNLPPATRILVATSTDEGAHFSRPVSATGPFRALPELAQPGSLRVILSPAASADAAGNLYLAWSAIRKTYGNGSAATDIWLKRSTDGGKHWGRRVRVNDARAGDRFMPVVTILHDGSVGVAFYDRRDGWNQLGVYAADVTFSNGGQAGPNVRINALVSPIGTIDYIKPGSTCFAPGRFFGDYIGAAAGPGHSIDVTWSAGSLRERNQTDVWFANRSLGPPGLRRTRQSAWDRFTAWFQSVLPAF